MYHISILGTNGKTNDFPLFFFKKRSILNNKTYIIRIRNILTWFPELRRFIFYARTPATAVFLRFRGLALFYIFRLHCGALLCTPRQLIFTFSYAILIKITWEDWTTTMKKPFVTLEQLNEFSKQFPTPYHLYDERAIRENARKLKQAFYLIDN